MNQWLRWFELHTMHPLAWPYVILKSIQYALLPKTKLSSGIINTGIVCVVCGCKDFTEQGLCEKCGNIVL